LYTVTLTATGPGGSSNVSRQITVQSANPPVAGFTTDKTSGSAPLTVQFTDASTGGQITNYLWNFSDGSTSVERNPSHQFANVGTYNVILTVSGPGGVSSATRQITVGNPIQASINAVPDANNPLRINLSAIVSGGSGTYTAYDWDFGNGQTLMGQSTPNTSVTYASANTYTVTLTVTDSTGTKKTVTQPVTIQAPPPPLAGDFTITQTNPTDLNVGFSASATGGSGNYTYSWNFGDSTNAGSGESVNHSYGTSGTYTVTLTINDGANNTTVSKQVTIQAVQPTLAGDFTITQASPTDPNISVSATAAGGTGNYTYTWAFGDGNTGSGQSANNTYAGAGTFTITLTIADGANSVDVVKDVTINALPPLAGDFTITQSSPTDPNIGVSATATGGTGNYTYTWAFGDGNTGSGQSANNTYAGAGTFTITLTIADGANSVDVVKDVTIDTVQLPPLTGDFTITQASPTDLNISVTASASGGTGNYTYSWDFGDGSVFTGDIPTNRVYTYAGAGSYTITLTISDGTNTFPVSKSVIIEATQPPFASTVPILDNIGDLTGNLSPVYNNGQNAGLSSSAFGVVGDQTAADPNFLRTIFNLDPNMSNIGELQATIDRFNTTGSFTRSSVGVGTITAQDLLNITSNPACNGAETLLQCEMRLSTGSIVIVSIGYQDAVNNLDNGSFEAQINQIVQQALASNVIPVLMTIQPSTNPTVNDKIDDFNEIILNVANNSNVPVINTWRALNELPNQGLSGENPSVDGNGAGYLSNTPTAGANARNYYTLVTLNDIVNTLFAP
jgi:PKD repeat protein